MVGFDDLEEPEEHGTKVAAQDVLVEERPRRLRFQRRLGRFSIAFFVAAMVVSFLYSRSFNLEAGPPAAGAAFCSLLWLIFVGLVLSYVALEPPFRGEVL